jgi:hypothetical protein
MPGSSVSLRLGYSGYFSSMTDLSFIEGGRKVRRWTKGPRGAKNAAVRRGNARPTRRDNI